MAKKKKGNSGGFIYSTNPDFNPIEEDNKEQNLSPSQQNLTVQRESKGRGGKVVTIIFGFSVSDEKLEELGKMLKNKCGVGGSVKEGEIILQGDFRSKVAEILKKEGYKVKISGL
jgi:translation initiation factor 1